MIDYRPIIISHIQAKLNNIDVRDGMITFKEPQGDYVSFYELNKSIQSFNNDIDYQLSINDTLTVKYAPLTIVELQLDVRGINSYTNCNLLFNSFDTIKTKEDLKDQGIFLMNKSPITPLPQVKNTKVQEGYLFTISFSYDNDFVDTELLAKNLILNGEVKDGN